MRKAQRITYYKGLRHSNNQKLPKKRAHKRMYAMPYNRILPKQGRLWRRRAFPLSATRRLLVGALFGNHNATRLPKFA